MFLTIIEQLPLVSAAIHPNALNEPKHMRADVSLKGAQCNIEPAQLTALKKKAATLLWYASEKSFSQFPIDRQKLIRSMISRFLKTETICAVLTNVSGATKNDHNNLREGFKQATLSPEDAIMRGLATAMIPLNPICPRDYDWVGSEVYNGISNCEEVVDLINRDRQTPAVMYSANMKADDVDKYLNDPSNTPLHIRYAKDGLKLCKGGEGFTDSFNVLNVSRFWSDLELPMRTFHGKNWSAWTLLKGCEDDSGRRYEAGDLTLDFGMRVFVPVNVETEGRVEERTIVLGVIAAASSHPLAKWLPASLASRRWFAGELAKKLFLEAKEKDWKVTTFE